MFSGVCSQVLIDLFNDLQLVHQPSDDSEMVEVLYYQLAVTIALPFEVGLYKIMRLNPLCDTSKGGMWAKLLIIH
jgi:hypothetical protein